MTAPPGLASAVPPRRAVPLRPAPPRDFAHKTQAELLRGMLYTPSVPDTCPQAPGPATLPQGSAPHPGPRG